ncbi:tRNA (guanosine(37)-N1)-methyltransferase TrmD [Peptococcaceae bacterium]|nr:tRNA (guanosine(37)-N1)-methyltransferase TrmD [Peptococcaceae bacterium]
MRIDILTLFPEMFFGPFDSSIIKRARDRGILNINLVNIRDFSQNKHRTVDDTPYGGGSGMIIQADPVFRAVESLNEGDAHVIMMCPQGRTFNQSIAMELSRKKHLILICGHYEGIDERVRESLVSDEISIGDYVLTGGELPAMVVVDAVARLIPGVLGEMKSAVEDSFYEGFLDYPSYTKPRVYRDMKVPEVLLSGHHENIRVWRRGESLIRTLVRKPDLLKKAKLTCEDIEILRDIKEKITKILQSKKNT